MSLKRYALIAAASQYAQQYKNNTKITTTSTIATLQQSQEQLENNKNETTIEILNKDNDTTTTIKTTTIAAQERPAFAPAIVQPHFILNPVASGTSSHVESGSSSPSITTYYGGGLGVFHQQNIRAGSAGSTFGSAGSSLNGAGVIGAGGIGSSYSQNINGNVNLLLGGAMLSLITTVLCVVCYCCHRNIKKRTEAEYRQQSQWLENDPNMEIYSVEQCYETSGIFLGESTDGLPTVPTLSHEPPPSYDAVLAMQEQQRIMQQQQQQQQQLLQQHSPPPGYRSTLDISNNNNHSNNNNSIPILISSGSYRHATTDANGNLNSCDNSEHLEPSGSNNQNNNMLHWKFCTLNTTGTSNLSARSELIKKVLHAQSCCSLQRAEVESMWNAAAAAVAARQNQNQNVTNNVQNEFDHMPRKSLPLCSSLLAHKRACGSNNLTLCVLGQQANYRRGCPLCGKFRYAETLSLSVSTESGLNLDEASGYSAVNNNNNNNNTNNNFSRNSIDYAAECACSTHTAAAPAAADDLKNGNTIMHSESTAACNMLIESAQVPHNNAMADKEDNNANIATTACQVLETSSLETSTSIEQPQLNLDTINENGIVRVDMSKIIDKTGLPTYEAALKLESSGYV